MQHMETSSCSNSTAVRRGLQQWEGYRRQAHPFTIEGSVANRDNDEGDGSFVVTEEARNARTGRFAV